MAIGLSDQFLMATVILPHQGGSLRPSGLCAGPKALRSSLWQPLARLKTAIVTPVTEMLALPSRGLRMAPMAQIQARNPLLRNLEQAMVPMQSGEISSLGGWARHGLPAPGGRGLGERTLSRGVNHGLLQPMF